MNSRGWWALCLLPVAGVLGVFTAGAVKAGLFEPRPEASRALWIESGSMLFFFFFFLLFFSLPFLCSFLMSQGSGRLREGGGGTRSPTRSFNVSCARNGSR